MENTVRSAGCPAISATSAGGCELFGPQEQRAQRVERHSHTAAAELGQRNGQLARKRVYLDDTPATAIFAGMSGLRVWSPPV